MRRRIAVAAVLAVGLMLALVGCTFFAPQASLLPYDSSDGVSLNVGSIQLRNALAISPTGKDANLVGVFINAGKTEATVIIEYTAHVDGKATVTSEAIPLPAGAVLSLGNPGVRQLVLSNADVKPGALLKLFVQYGSVAGKNVEVPVLDGSEAAYRDLLPTPTPTPTLCTLAVPTPADSCAGPLPTPTPTPVVN